MFLAEWGIGIEALDADEDLESVGPPMLSMWGEVVFRLSDEGICPEFAAVKEQFIPHSAQIVHLAAILTCVEELQPARGPRVVEAI